MQARGGEPTTNAQAMAHLRRLGGILAVLLWSAIAAGAAADAAALSPSAAPFPVETTDVTCYPEDSRSSIHEARKPSLGRGISACLPGQSAALEALQRVSPSRRLEGEDTGTPSAEATNDGERPAHFNEWVDKNPGLTIALGCAIASGTVVSIGSAAVLHHNLKKRKRLFAKRKAAAAKRKASPRFATNKRKKKQRKGGAKTPPKPAEPAPQADRQSSAGPNDSNVVDCKSPVAGTKDESEAATVAKKKPVAAKNSYDAQTESQKTGDDSGDGSETDVDSEASERDTEAIKEAQNQFQTEDGVSQVDTEPADDQAKTEEAEAVAQESPPSAEGSETPRSADHVEAPTLESAPSAAASEAPEPAAASAKEEPMKEIPDSAAATVDVPLSGDSPAETDSSESSWGKDCVLTVQLPPSADVRTVEVGVYPLLHRVVGGFRNVGKDESVSADGFEIPMPSRCFYDPSRPADCSFDVVIDGESLSASRRELKDLPSAQGPRPKHIQIKVQFAVSHGFDYVVDHALAEQFVGRSEEYLLTGEDKDVCAMFENPTWLASIQSHPKVSTRPTPPTIVARSEVCPATPHSNSSLANHPLYRGSRTSPECTLVWTQREFDYCLNNMSAPPALIRIDRKLKSVHLSFATRTVFDRSFHRLLPKQCDVYAPLFFSKHASNDLRMFVLEFPTVNTKEENALVRITGPILRPKSDAGHTLFARPSQSSLEEPHTL
eukprot:GHVT01102481.1.p1 GENE.GHVT01102481.1~~GHVT01102481.1.p1  ORF type:complete len:721 (-),score=120.50 GHVT01102481.1:431-2593(-)